VAVKLLKGNVRYRQGNRLQNGTFIGYAIVSYLYPSLCSLRGLKVIPALNVANFFPKNVKTRIQSESCPKTVRPFINYKSQKFETLYQAYSFPKS